MTDEHTTQVMQVWDAVSPAWERHRQRIFDDTRVVSEWLVDAVDPSPGETVLEIGAGPGETGFLAAERVGPEGRLVSTDVSEGMVEAARRGAAARGLTNVEHRVMDAQQIELPDGSVDAVISRFALMLIPDQGKVVAGVHRVLRPGGRLAYVTWGGIDRNPWVTTIIGAILQSGHAPPAGPADNPFAPGGLFSLSTPEANAALLADAGFGDVSTRELTGAMHYESVADYWDTQTSLAGPLTQMLASLPADAVATIRSTAEQLAEPYRVEGGYDLPFTAMAVQATR